MGRIKKKGTSGQAKNFITRTQAVRKLQVSLPDFRRLCIFKGIYPREPRHRRRASKSSTQSTTFAKFRDHKALAKKIARALGRQEVGDAARLEQKGNTRISLDHVIKERYPTFVDALRDLDDALSLLFLFANLPSTSTVPSKTIALCQRLCLEFEHYLIATNSLRKSFLSIKGIYYQALIQGQDILWLVPYKFVQRVTGDVDFRIMGTFVEFYTTLLGFVNFRLYTSIGLVYPPKFNAASDEQGGELGAFTLEGKSLETPQEIEAPVNGNTESAPNGELQTNSIQKQIDAIENKPYDTDIDDTLQQDPTEPPPSDAIDTFEPTAPDADILPQPAASATEASTLFAPFTFFLSRETPRQPLEFILRAFGCKRVGWDIVLGDGAFTNNENDPTITHQVVDRPPLTTLPVAQDSMDLDVAQTAKPGGRILGRTYIQPQWVWDCINGVKLLRPDLYAPGAILPPHLSPWVKPKKGIYDPTAPLAEQEREGEAEEAEELDDDDDEEGPATKLKVDAPVTSTALAPAPDTEGADPHGMTIANNSSDSDSNSAEAEINSDISSFAGFQSPSPSPSPTTLHQRELEAEYLDIPLEKANGAPLKSILKPTRKKRLEEEEEEEEQLERRKMMMGKKKRKMVERMMFGNRKREVVAERLRGKRRRVEREMEIEKGKGEGGL